MTTVILAVLATIGLAALLWLIFGTFLMPAGTPGTMRIYLLASGEADDVEHTLRGLKWLRNAGLLAGKVDILDAGLDGVGRARVKHLLKQYPGVHLIQTDKSRE